MLSRLIVGWSPATLGVALMFSAAALVRSEEVSSATNAVSFSKDIAPILAQKCVTCHGPEKTKGGYQLHTFAALMKPGESKAPSIAPGQSDKSELFRLITTRDSDDRMPQKDDPLPAGHIALIGRWIQEGAKFDGADVKQPLTSLVAAGPQPDPPAAYSLPVPVMALAFSPDGAELAAGGYHEITIWFASDGRLLRRIKNVAQQTASLAFNADGSLLAAAGGTPGKLGEVKLFRPATGELLKTLATSGDTMLAVVFSADGKRLAASGSDNAIRIFDLATGKQELFIEQHADWVFGLAFSPDGAVLASASRDKTARLFDAKTGELEQTYAGHAGPVFGVAFGADGKRVFSASRDKEIHVWETAEARKITEITGFEGDVLKVIAVSMTAISNQIFSASTDRRVRHHSLDGKKAELVRTFSGHEDFVYALAYHGASGRLASGSFDGEVRLWDTSSGQLLTNYLAAPGYEKPVTPQTAGKPSREQAKP